MLSHIDEEQLLDAITRKREAEKEINTLRNIISVHTKSLSAAELRLLEAIHERDRLLRQLVPGE